MALAHQGPYAPPLPGPRRLPSLEHPVPGRDRLHPAGPLPGRVGKPADDTTCLSINYLFSSLLRSGRLEGPFEKMFLTFWDNYLARTNDREMLEVAAPFFAWRGLVIASPVWYPHLPAPMRQTIFRFIRNVLDAHRVRA